jgi:hypothetical protein
VVSGVGRVRPRRTQRNGKDGSTGTHKCLPAFNLTVAPGTGAAKNRRYMTQVAGNSQDPAIETDTAHQGPVAASGSEQFGYRLKRLHRRSRTESRVGPLFGVAPRELHHGGLRMVFPQSARLARHPKIPRRGSLAGKGRNGYPALPGNSFSSTFAIACG